MNQAQTTVTSGLGPSGAAVEWPGVEAARGAAFDGVGMRESVYLIASRRPPAVRTIKKAMAPPSGSAANARVRFDGAPKPGHSMASVTTVGTAATMRIGPAAAPHRRGQVRADSATTAPIGAAK